MSFGVSRPALIKTVPRAGRGGGLGNESTVHLQVEPPAAGLNCHGRSLAQGSAGSTPLSTWHHDLVIAVATGQTGYQDSAAMLTTWTSTST
jgi:hypothetical protein